MFRLFRTYLFVRALFGQNAKYSTREARPDTSVEVRARSVPSGARGGRSRFLFRREWIRRFPWFQYERPYFVRTYTYRYNNVVSFLLMSCEHTSVVIRTFTRHTSDSMHRSHRYNAVAHTPQYCCGWLCSSEPAVRIPQSALP